MHSFDSSWPRNLKSVTLHDVASAAHTTINISDSVLWATNAFCCGILLGK